VLFGDVRADLNSGTLSGVAEWIGLGVKSSIMRDGGRDGSLADTIIWKTSTMRNW